MITVNMLHIYIPLFVLSLLVLVYFVLLFVLYKKYEIIDYRISELEDPYIGEVLVYERLSSYNNPVHNCNRQVLRHLKWKKFRKSDIDFNKDHDGYVSVYGTMHKKENIIFYVSSIDIQKKAVENRIKKECSA